MRTHTIVFSVLLVTLFASLTLAQAPSWDKIENAVDRRLDTR